MIPAAERMNKSPVDECFVTGIRLHVAIEVPFFIRCQPELHHDSFFKAVIRILEMDEAG